jgi:hypothetical protein
MYWGFRRKDHWLKHLRAKHSASREEVRDLQGKWIPMPILQKGLGALV